MKRIILLIALFPFVILLNSFHLPEKSVQFQKRDIKSAEPEIVPGIVVIKLKSSNDLNHLSKISTTTGIQSIDNRLQKYNVLSVEKMFKSKSIQNNNIKTSISNIMRLNISENINPITVINELKNDPNIEYAEPVYKRWILEVPNDPKFSQQQYLTQIKAPEAWDVQKGDSNVVIAIVDVGVDLEHEDLKANLWTNKIEANGITGVDDDNNGYIDDMHGWDFGDNDADPSNASEKEYFAYSHGTHCAGIACAVSDNNIGISGVSWNCKFMAIKTVKGNVEQHINGYYGIIYAADNGADIISNSWGGPGFLQWEQEVVNYAYQKGSIIVCAAGNTGSEGLYYPAAYEKSISVASIEMDDTKSDFSTFGLSIDISAPGSGILSATPNNKYDFSLGTSMACPIVAGVLGLVKSLHTDWTNNQIIKYVLLSSDDITNKNLLYKNRLGHGKINAFNALTLSELHEADARLALFSFEFDDSLYGNNNKICELGETIILRTKIRNYSVGATNTATFNLASPSSDVVITQGNYFMVSFPADTTETFEFTIDISDECKVYELNLNLEMTTNLGFSNNETIPLTIGTKPLLLLDHDDSWSIYLFTQIEPFYINILDGNKIPYAYWNFIEYGFPKLEFIKKYPIVILFKETYPVFYGSQSRFTSEERKILKEYLDEGGNLFIAGPNIGFELYNIETEIEAIEFMKYYLHAEFIEDMTDNLFVKGIEGDPISDSISFNLYQPYTPDPYPFYDVIKPTEGADSIFNYGNGKTGAVKFSGEYKVIYSGFGLEAIDSDPNTEYSDMSSIRSEVLMRSLNWLNFIEHTALSDTSDTTITRSVFANIRPISPEVKSMKLFWKEKTDLEYDSLYMDRNLSQFSCTIPCLNKSTTIDYYIKTEFDYFTWTNPVGAPDNIYSFNVGIVTSIEDENIIIPNTFSLSQNYPNPFNPSTTIKYSIPSKVKSETANRFIPSGVEGDKVVLKVYDILGREVAKLVNQKQKPGNYEVTWDGNTQPSGVYFYQLKYGDFAETKKMIFLK